MQSKCDSNAYNVSEGQNKSRKNIIFYKVEFILKPNINVILPILQSPQASHRPFMCLD